MNVKIFRKNLILVTLLIVAFANIGFASEIQVVTAKDWNKTKEYTAEIDNGHLFWCSNKEIAVLRGKSHNVSTITFYNNDLTNPKEETVNFAAHTSKHPICSDDSRYIFFSKQIRADDPQNFFYYDRKTKRADKIFQYKKTLTGIEENQLISPKRKYFITPSSSNEITLPGVGNLKGISLDAILEKDNSSYVVLAWDISDSKLYLLSQTLSIIDSNTLQRQNISVEIEGYWASNIKATGNPNKLFLVATHELIQNENLYLLDLKNKKKPITLLVKNIESLDVSYSGMGVYTKIDIIQHLTDGKIHPYDNTKSYVSVDVIDSSRNKKIIKKFNSDKGNSIRMVQGPKISPDGNAVAFISKSDFDKNMKIYVIQRIK